MRGIDYGLGKANVNNETGIRYGVISQHTPMAEALDDIYTHGEDLSYASAVDDAKGRIASALEQTLDDMGLLPYVPKYSASSQHLEKRSHAMVAIVDAVWSEIEQDFNDQYTADDATYRYEQDGYIIETSSLGLYVIRSPFYTLCSFCSPCAPGAGDLDTPDAVDGVKTYCLGADWFEDNIAPYPVFEVSANA